jgi:hypothetical protein
VLILPPAPPPPPVAGLLDAAENALRALAGRCGDAASAAALGDVVDDVAGPDRFWATRLALVQAQQAVFYPAYETAPLTARTLAQRVADTTRLWVPALVEAGARGAKPAPADAG